MRSARVAAELAALRELLAGGEITRAEYDEAQDEIGREHAAPAPRGPTEWEATVLGAKRVLATALGSKLPGGERSLRRRRRTPRGGGGGGGSGGGGARQGHYAPVVTNASVRPCSAFPGLTLLAVTSTVELQLRAREGEGGEVSGGGGGGAAEQQPASPRAAQQRGF